MKKRLFTAMLLLMLAVSQFPVQLFANTGSEMTVNTWDEFEKALENPQYSTINFGKDIRTPRQKDDTPFIISRNVIINGGDKQFILNNGGIILGGDVVFNNTTITFENPVRNAIIANGYNLTLNNVKSGHRTFLVNVFAGEMTNYKDSKTMPNSGSNAHVTIGGVSELGQIFAGSLAEGNPTTPPQPNKYQRPSSITINASKGSVIGDIYAHGGYEPRDGSNPGGMVGNATEYQVTEDVTINLNSSSVKNVYGKTGGTTGAKLIYNDQESLLNTNVMLKDLSSLEVKAGKLTPRQGSTFSQNANITISGQTSELNLESYGNVSINDFKASNDAYLGLGKAQTLTINGRVSGTAKVAIGGVFNQGSWIEPVLGHTYIIAKHSMKDNFVLLPKYNADLYLEKDQNGNWTVAQQQGIVVKSELTDFNFVDTNQTVTEDLFMDYGGSYELTCTFKNGIGTLDEIPMNYTVRFGSIKGMAKTQADGYARINNLNLQFFQQGDGVQDNALFVEPINPNEKVQPGIYTIEILVPVNYKLVKHTLTLTITNNDGTIPPMQHEHVWNYHAEGSKIIAECAGIGDCDVINRTVTLQLKAPTNLVYDGNVKEVTVEGNVPGVVTPTVQYKNATTPVNAGNHEASITLFGATATLPFVISKAEGTGTVSIENWTEGEQAKQPTVSTNTNDETRVFYEYKLKDANDSSYQSFDNAPTVAGEYVLKATFEETQNYNQVLSYTNFTIHKKPTPIIDKKIVKSNLTSVPTTLPQYQNIEALKEAMEKEILIHDGYTKENTKFLDIKLKLSYDNGNTFVDATEKDFPTEGIVVEFLYQDIAPGVGKDTHDFMVTHMHAMTSDRLGTIAGEIEKPIVTKLDDRIRVTLRGFSPVSISWKTLDSESNHTPIEKEPNTNHTPIATPQTGDNTQTQYIVITMLFSTFILGILRYTRLKKQ